MNTNYNIKPKIVLAGIVTNNNLAKLKPLEINKFSAFDQTDQPR
jgi:hypothetical protein